MSSSFNDIINIIRGHSQNLRSHAEAVRKAEDYFFRNTHQLDQFLAALDFKEHCVGVCQVLYVRWATLSIDSSVDDVEVLIAQTHQLFDDFSQEAMKPAIDIFSNLVKEYASGLISRDRAIQGIYPLLSVIPKIQEQNFALTSSHAYLLQLCLSSNCLKPALQVIDEDITDIGKDCQKSGCVNFLLYYYYAGVIYLALKNFERAHLMFEIVVTTPALVVSKIMLEAYKKFLLVSHLLHGSVTELPRYTVHLVVKYIKPMSAPYHELVGVKEPRNCAHVAQKNQSYYTSDGNFGLVKQVVNAFYRRSMQRLTRTYLTLSLQEIASAVGLADLKEVERQLVGMVEDRQILARISHEGVVRFVDPPAPDNSLLAQLNLEIARVMALNEKVKALDDEIAVNGLYVKKCLVSFDDEGLGKSAFF